MKHLPIPTIKTYGVEIPSHREIVRNLRTYVEEHNIVNFTEGSGVLATFKHFYNMSNYGCNCGVQILTAHEIIAYALVYRDPVALSFDSEHLAVEYDRICHYLDSESFELMYTSYLLKKQLGVD